MKKKSLFSQRIKQARSKQNQSDSSFPKALSIGVTCNQASDSLKHIQCKNDHEIQKIEIASQKQEKQLKQGSFVNKLLISEFNEEQIGKIHNQNMQSIAAMSQQQREKYRQMILKQIPSSLLNKLKKSQKQQSNQNNQNSECPIENKDEGKKDEIPANQRENQMGDEKQEGYEEQLQRMNGEKEQIKEGMGSLQHLMLNIEKGEIIYNYSEQKVGTPSILSMSEIKQMIENENNQTQIVASRLICQVCSLLFLPNQQISNHQIGIPLIKISEQYFHLCSLAQDLYTNHIKSLVWQMRRTNFKSCWVEMVTAFTCFVKIVSKWLKLSSNGQNTKINEIQTQISALFDRKVHFIGNQRQAASINLLIAQLQTAKQELQKFNDDSLSIQILIRQNPTQCLDLLLVQESLNSGWLTLLNRLTLQSKRQKHTQFEKASYIIFTLYPLIVELYARDSRANFLNQELKVVKEWIYHWIQREVKINLMQNQFTKQKYEDQQQQQLIFKYLQSIKIVSIQSYSQLLQHQADKQTISVPNDVLANQLTFLNLEQYFKSSQHDASETENIQQMFNYLNNKLGNGPNYINKISYIILTNLFCVFINHLEYPNIDPSTKQNRKRISYHDINQTTLNAILVSLCQYICQNQQLALLWQVISEEKLKSLIDSYNYSSFGNYCFTRLLLFLTASCPMDGTKSMILEEVVARYPFLFYNAAKEGVYGPEELYTKGKVLPEMQSIYQILTFKDKKQESNMLIRFILRK